MNKVFVMNRLTRRPNPLVRHGFTARIRQEEGGWIGIVEEVPGVISEGNTREELMENLVSALEDVLEVNRMEASRVFGVRKTEEVALP